MGEGFGGIPGAMKLCHKMKCINKKKYWYLSQELQSRQGDRQMPSPFPFGAAVLW